MGVLCHRNLWETMLILVVAYLSQQHTIYQLAHLLRYQAIFGA